MDKWKLIYNKTLVKFYFEINFLFTVRQELETLNDVIRGNKINFVYLVSVT